MGLEPRVPPIGSVSTGPGGDAEASATGEPLVPGERLPLAKGTRDVSQQARAIAAAPTDLGVASVVHDLRSPLAVIGLEAELLLERLGASAEPAVCRSLIRIAHNTSYLERLVDDLLDLAADGDGQLALARDRVDLGELAASTVARAVASVARRRISLVTPAPVWVEGDARRLERVVANLVGNALKFSVGGVTVRVVADGGTAVLEVEDRGPGLAPAQAQAVFERFRRAAGASGPEGHGLGLYLSKRIIDAHGGSIGVTSTPGQGSRFAISLPLAP